MQTKTTVTYNNSTTNFDQAIHTGLKRIFGFAQHIGGADYLIKDGTVQVCPISEYRILLKNDEMFERRVVGDGEEEGVIILKDYMTKKTEKHVVIRQSQYIS